MALLSGTDCCSLALGMWGTLAPLGSGQGALVFVVMWPQGPVARITAAKRLLLSLSQAGREMSCVLLEAGLPTCCCGPAPPRRGPGAGRAWGFTAHVFSEASSSSSAAGSCLIFLSNCFIVIWDQTAPGYHYQSLRRNGTWLSSVTLCWDLSGSVLDLSMSLLCRGCEVIGWQSAGIQFSNNCNSGITLRLRNEMAQISHIHLTCDLRLFLPHDTLSHWMMTPV